MKYLLDLIENKTNIRIHMMVLGVNKSKTIYLFYKNVWVINNTFLKPLFRMKWKANEALCVL